MINSKPELCDLLIGLLGQPAPENGQIFMDIIDQINEKPVLAFDFPSISEYNFPLSGISISFDRDLRIFDCLVFELRCFEGSDRKPFTGRLPYGIKRTDSEQQVEQEFPGSTMRLKDYRFDADLRPLAVQFVFQAAGHLDASFGGERTLALVVIDYADPKKNPNKAVSLGYDVR